MRKETPTVQHLALHLAKEAGLLAAAAEKMDHREEAEIGRQLFLDWMENRSGNVKRTLDLLTEAMHRVG